MNAASFARSKDIERGMTQLANLPDSIRNGDDYLDALEFLCGAIEGGITALAAGQLAEFKEQLARQENCCFLLLRVDPPDPAFSCAPYVLHENNQELNARIRTAHEKLARLNRIYRAFLRHSARSVALLASHCQTYLRHCGGDGDWQSTDKLSLAEV